MIVTLYSSSRAKQADTFTDAQGRYVFAGLAAGSYGVAADNDDRVSTYLKQWFGVDGPADLFTPPPGPNIEIRPGESRANVDIAMMRGLAIEGRVIDPLGEPVRGVEVLATHADGKTPAMAGVANSNDEGTYRVFGLTPGRYRVCAYVTTGSSGPPPADGSPRAPACYPDVTLTSQDSVNIDIHVTAGAIAHDPAASAPTPESADTGTIRGVVVDKDSGRPIPRAVVRLGFRGPAGPPAVLTAATDDAGVFSLPGLPPGSYNGFVNATGHVLTTLIDQDRSGTLSVHKGQTLKLTTALPRAYAMAVRLVDASDTPISGIRVSVRTLDGRPAASPYGFPTDDRGHVRVPELPPGQYIVCADPDGSPGASRYVSQRKGDQLLRTCFPSARNEADAQPITLGNADLEDVEIRMVRGRTLSISGTIVDSGGAPAPHAIVQFTRYSTSGTLASSFGIGADARFVIANVQPGAYAIEATTDRETAFVPVRVDDDDIDSLVVAMHRTTTVPGRISADDPSIALPARAGAAPLQISMRLADERLAGSGSSIHATANSDNTFALTGVFGTRRIDIGNEPKGWFVKAIRYGTTDAIDAAIDFRDDGTPLDVVLSTHGASLTGTVQDVVAHRVDRALVFLLRAPINDADVPRVAASVLSSSGTYSFAPLRDGEYVVVAVPSGTPYPQSGEWDRIARLFAAGERVTLVDQEQRTLDLRIAAVR